MNSQRGSCENSWIEMFPRTILMLILCTHCNSASSEATADERQEAVTAHVQQAAEFADAEAKRYRFWEDGNSEELKLVPESVLRWSNPTGGEVHGSVVLWLNQGCPAAAASMYVFFHMDQVNVELVSLSEVALKAERNGRVRWTPEKAAVAFAEIPGAPDAADTLERRRLQARALSRQFSGELTTDPGEGIVAPLRLLTRPLHEYQATDDSGREGAVFAFATANDPELLLMIESRPVEATRNWFYAAARMHFCPLRLSHREQMVWEVPQVAPPWDDLRGPDGNYIVLEWPTPEAAKQDGANENPR